MVNGEITAISDKVAIGGKIYTVASNLSGLFSASNESVLSGAKVSVTVKNNEITEVKQLTINKSGKLDAKATTISKLIVNADNVSIENLEVTGDVILTNQVIESFNVANVTMGNFITPETPKLVANTRTIAASTMRLKITFTDSTVAYVEIRQDHLDFSILGKTTITSFSLKADDAVIDSPNNLLPSIKIGDGVSKVMLNATIKNVEIETNTMLEITGKGNFENVSVKTDKTVALLTEGTIGSLNSEAKNIELGKNVKVDQTLLSGEVVSGDEIIVNIAEVEGNVNKPIEEGDKETYFVAKPMKVNGKHGVYTLSLINAGNATIKYETVSNPRRYPMPVAGQQAPETAKVYNPGDAYVAYFSNELYVYKTDENNVILETFKLDRTQHNHGYTEVVQNGKTLDIKVTFAEKQSLNYFIIATEKDFFVTEQFEYSVDEDGVPTYTVILPTDFELTSESAIIHDTHGATDRTRTEFSSRRSYGNNKHEQVHINYLTSFAKQFDADTFIGNKFDENFYQQFASNLRAIFRYEEVIKNQGDFYYTTVREVVKSFTEKDFATFEEVKQEIQKILDAQSSIIEQLNQVSDAIKALYVSDERTSNTIRTDLTEQDFQNIQLLINQLEGNLDQNDLQKALTSAKSYFEQKMESNGTIAALEASTLRYSVSEVEPVISSTVNW